MSREQTRSRKILFLQGAGAGAHAEDRGLVSSLRAALGTEYEIRYPKMPDEDAVDYEPWEAWLARELTTAGEPLIVVAHSAGGHALLRYLSEAKAPGRIIALFLIAIPYLGAGGWDADGVNTQEIIRRPTFAAQITSALPVYFYHSRDDNVVPFSHLALYKTQLPWATFRELDGRGHQLGNDLTDVARDIQSL